jgi:hypothetical protein
MASLPCRRQLMSKRQNRATPAPAFLWEIRPTLLFIDVLFLLDRKLFYIKNLCGMEKAAGSRARSPPFFLSLLPPSSPPSYEEEREEEERRERGRRE